MTLTYEEAGVLLVDMVEEHGTSFSVHYAREHVGRQYLTEEAFPGIAQIDRDILMRIDGAYSWRGLFHGADYYNVDAIEERVRKMSEVWAEGAHFIAMHWERLPDSEIKAKWSQSQLAAVALAIRELIVDRFDERDRNEPLLMEHDIFRIMGNNLLGYYHFILGDELVQWHFDRLNETITHLRQHVEILNALNSLEDDDLPIM